METTRTALVVGGTSGIGLATARRAAVADAAPELVAHRVDGNDRAAVTELAGSLTPIDALVLTISSSAGLGPLADLDLAELRKGFDEKLIAMLTVLQAALPHLAERASIP